MKKFVVGVIQSKLISTKLLSLDSWTGTSKRTGEPLLSEPPLSVAKGNSQPSLQALGALKQVNCIRAMAPERSPYSSFCH